MKMNGIRTFAALAFLAAGTTNCRDQEEDGIVARETCAKVCSLVVCDGATEVDESYISDCSDRCVDKGDEARASSQQCTDAYVRTVDCFGDLRCPDYIAWENGDTTICDAELTGFMESCPGMTFDFRE